MYVCVHVVYVSMHISWVVNGTFGIYKHMHIFSFMASS